MSEILKNLNEKQKEVVLSTEGPVLVLAGAGSGKTKALTHRIAYLVEEKKINPGKILAITFTNKAASEMGERVKKLLGKTQLPTMGTFHSICARLLRKEIHRMGWPANFTIFDEDDSIRLIKQCLKKLNVNTEKTSPSTIKSYISSAKNELIDEEQYASYADSYRETKIIDIYKLYQKELKKNEALDFDDLIFTVVKLFQKHPEVLEKYQDLWQYILVDEYQDTNEAQYVLTKLLAEKSKNICVVGDDWQSIYSWRGANFQNILNFEKDYPESLVIKLEQNYRSTKAILQAAQSVIEKNANRSQKTIWTENKPGTQIKVYEAGSETDEGSFVCQEVLRLNARGISFKEMAVFYRTNAQSRSLEEQLLRYRIPYKIVGGVRFYERKEIKDLLAWLKMAAGCNDWISFERSLLSPPSGIGKVTLEKLKKYAELNDLKITELVLAEEIVTEIGLRAIGLLNSYFLKIEKIKNQKQVSKAVETAVNQSGLVEYLSDGTAQNEERIENLKELISVASEYEKMKENLDLVGFLEEVALISDLDNYQEKEDGLTLMTVHSAKGLEYKIVLIVGLEENIFPHSRSLFEPAQLEEERRLFYVALTRAKEEAYLVYATSRLYFGNIQSNPPSRFIIEIPEPLLTYLNQEKREEKELEEEVIPGAFRVGDTVEHENFGKGEVRAVMEDELTVYFPGYGKKIISVFYAPIKKV